MTIHDGKFILEHVKRMNHMDQAGFNISSAMTCILPMAQVVYVGDDDGRVVSFSLLGVGGFSCTCYYKKSHLTVFGQYEWDCIQRHG